MKHKYIRSYIFLALFLMQFALSASSWKREASGFSVTENFTFDESKVILYKNSTTWKDSIGNYGTSKCYGLIVSNNKQIISDYKMYCKFIDQDDDEFTHKYFRDSDFKGGVGSSILIAGKGKWSKSVGAKCTYAIDYLKNSLFLVEKCSL